jgi:long-chain acyl-CoA synthetase
VAEVGVVGLPDQMRGEVVKAFVVLRAGQSATPSELKGFCRDRLVHYKVPAKFEVVTELPKTQVGKVLRRVLREIEDNTDEVELAEAAPGSPQGASAPAPL